MIIFEEWLEKKNIIEDCARKALAKHQEKYSEVVPITITITITRSLIWSNFHGFSANCNLILA